MKGLVFKAVIKILVKSIVFAAMIGVVIGIIGYINKWNSQITYSNAFFLAGALVILAGTASRLGAGQERSNHLLVSAESFREMNSSERANLIIDASTSMSLVILGLLTGVWLILFSAIILYVL
jgi:hypothetical protein